MTVLRAAVLGYCAGVRRAMDMAFQALRDHPGKEIRTYGPLIHNPTALRSLEQAGIHPLCPGSQADVVILRAHGVSPETQRALEAGGAAIVDATCPRVKESQKRALEFAAAGRTVIIAGDRQHGEVAGIAGYAGDCVILENAADAEAFVKGLPEGSKGAFALIAQTTISQDEYAAVRSVLLSRLDGSLEVAETLCPEAQRRQDAVRELCMQVDGVLVIGGRESANTRRLFALAGAHAAHAALIEGPEEIPARFFALDRVGITAGASTPEEVIAGVERRLEKRSPPKAVCVGEGKVRKK
jgi:4-hydroxy-3-methylbut-2-enyl diphosphate reductase